MIEVTIRQKIERPADEVFAFLADASNNPRWQKGMVACTWEEDAIGVGAHYRQEARFLGRPIVSRFVVTAYEPGRSISIETVESTFPIQVTRSVEPDGDGCVAQAVVSGEPAGVFKLFGPLMKPMLEGSVTKDYARLASLLEARA